MTRIIVMTALALLALSLSLRAAENDDSEEMKKLEGTWQFEFVMSKGTKPPEDAMKAAKVVIAGGKFKVQIGDKVEDELSFKIKPGEKPKQLDLTYLQGEKKGKEELGIYELNGDTLKICSADAGEKRPSEFDAKEGTKNDLTVLKRVKKD